MMKLALVGSDIAHSLSPQLFDFFSRRCGIELSYQLHQLAPQATDEQLLDAARCYDAINVTMPFKLRMGQLLGQRCVNVVVNKEGKLRGYNTDGLGAVYALEYHGITLNKSKILLLGAGGAAYGVAASLANEGCAVNIVNRTSQKARELANSLALKGFRGYADVIISCLPRNAEISLTATQFNHAQLFMDCVYGESIMRTKAENYSLAVADGLAMLFFQGVAALQILCGVTFDDVNSLAKEFIDENTANSRRKP